MLADLHGNLGNIELEKGNILKAEELYNNAIDNIKNFYGEEYPSLADWVGNLGNVYLYQGKL